MSVTPSSPDGTREVSPTVPLNAYSEDEKLFKIARQLPCDECDCTGWKPGDEDETNAASRECSCGHTAQSHGSSHLLEEEEIDRRTRVALRIEELLEDAGKLDDYEYTDEDVESLRKQMLLTGSKTLPSRIPKQNGKRKSSNDDESGPKRIKLEDEDDEDEESEDEPLANGLTNGHKNGVKDEEATNEDDIVAGVNVDPSDARDGVKKEKPAVIEERRGIIQFRVVTNDNTPESMIILTGLKNIFQKQLPKMPREYISRLVYDRNHYSMAIVKKGLHVVGGVTYRPFNHRRFAEIVFYAITSTEQVKGYGSHLMNHLKDHVKKSSDVMHFLTYADNYAIGYFKKQGFSKEITLDRAIWTGYIKDYEGGTIMQCTMLPRIKYLEVYEILARQKEAIYAKIKEVSKSHIVYPGLEAFKDPKVTKVDVSEVPGLRDSGWTPEMDELARRPARGPHYNTMQHLISELQNHQAAWPFLQPVNRDEVADYYEVIKEPMDLSTMEYKLDNGVYQSLDEFCRDTQLIFDNCKVYNGETTPYYKNAQRLEKFYREKLREWNVVPGQ